MQEVSGMGVMGDETEAGQPPSLHDRVVGRLRDMIIDGELPAGGRVPERQICEQLGISRTPLREAYKVLASEGLLTLVPNRGALVARMTLDHVDDVMRLVIELEGIAAELACPRVTATQLAEISRLHEQMVAFYRAGELMAYFKVNQQIHEALVDAADNHALSQVYRSLTSRIRRFRYVGNLDAGRWSRAVREHEQILSALAERDAPLLKQLLRSHVRNGWLMVKELLRDELAPAEHETRTRRPPQRRIVRVA